ncbi:hypothetical protein [Caballeronia choica]|jgi:hypothetical protein|uniref:hypothetical protein n=1 Tax=Caballeronia choica TaxID=326476 RepID=UPI001F30D236|nr:hypothetical protein [Caballeronia choica]
MDHHQEEALDDRFERRELLLHLGDMLEAMRCVANANRPDACVAQLVNDERIVAAIRFSSRARAHDEGDRVCPTRDERIFSMAQGTARAAVKSRRADIVRAARLVRRESGRLERLL